MIYKLIILALSLLVVSPTWATIAILDPPITSESEACDPCTFASIPVSAGTNRKFIVIVGSEAASARTITGVTYNGVAMSSVVESEATANRVAIYELNDASIPAPGSYTVSVNFSASVVDVGIIAFSISGVDQIVARDTDAFTSASANTATLSLVGVLSTDFTVAAVTMNSTSTSWTYQAGATELAVNAFGATPSAAMAAAYELGEAAPSLTTTATVNRFVAVAATWAEVAGTTTTVAMGGGGEL